MIEWYYICLDFDTMMQKAYGIFFIAILTLFSFTPRKEVNKDLVLVSAVKQTIIGGVAGSPAITRYTIKVKSKRSFTIISDSAFAEGKIAMFEIQKDSFTATSQKYLKKGYTAVIGFSLVIPTEMGGSNYPVIIEGSPSAKCPIASGTGVVIRYKGGKSKYLDITKIKESETLYAP